jgi:hypothetical protein
MHAMNNRTPFDKVVGTGTIIWNWNIAQFLFRCCLSAKRYTKGTKHHRATKLYNNGYERYNNELDIIKLLQGVRTSKIVYRSLLTHR